MPVKAQLNFPGLDEYLRQLQELAIDLDDAAVDAVAAAAPLIESEMRAQAEKNRLTGGTIATIYITPVVSAGSYHFVEFGALVDNNSAALYDEYGTVYMEPRPFLRPAIKAVRSRWRISIKATLRARLGVPFE